MGMLLRGFKGEVELAFMGQEVGGASVELVADDAVGVDCSAPMMIWIEVVEREKVTPR